MCLNRDVIRVVLMKEIPLRYKAFILLCLVLIILSFFVGYGYGFQKGTIKSLEWGVWVAKNFVNIEFDEREIAAMMFAYKNRITGCYNISNGGVLNDNQTRLGDFS